MGENFHRNKPWFASTHTTAAGIALEFSGQSGQTTAFAYGGGRPVYRLRGVAVSGSTAVAVSTSPIKLVFGESSNNPATTK